MSIKTLAEATGISEQELWFTTKTKNTRYTHFTRRKANGSVRHIYAPDSQLKKVQFAILREALDKIPLPDYLWAFERGKSVPEMAKLHVGKTVVFSWDIKDYFGSIHQSLLNTVLGRYFPEKEAKYISELGTLKFFVPQGSLISPKLANIVTANTFGPVLQTFFTTRGGEFSVYADDITVSFRRAVLLEEAQQFTAEVAEALKVFNFRLNREKIKYMPKYKRQYVCGVVVNEKTTVLRKEKRLLRAIVHNVSRNGFEPEASKTNLTVEEFTNSITGRIGWFKQINPVQATPLYNKWRELVSTVPASPPLLVSSHDSSAT